VLSELRCLDLWFRGRSIKTRVAEAEEGKDKPASLEARLDQARGVLSLQNSASQELEEEEKEEEEEELEEKRSWMVTSGSSFRQEEVALATGERRGKLPQRPTLTTDFLVLDTCST